VVIRRVSPRIDFDDLRRELGLPAQFPAAAQREADEAAARPADDVVRSHADRTDIPFVTVDPATSRDLDQAVCLRRRPGGYRVHYAIADVASHVRPGGALEEETWRRGQTVYLPDGKVPLHPETLSEDAASLLPGVDRAAVLWTVDVADDGEPGAVRVQRARVRSRAKLDYVGVQRQADAGELPEPIALLPELGRLLAARALDRGAISLPLPEQELEADGDGWRLVLRGPVPIEGYNAQISLLTGAAAAGILLAGGVGLLRTMPPPRPEALARLRVAATGLGIDWPAGASPGALIASLDPTEPRAAALLDHAAELLRGAGYTAFDGRPPEQAGHGGVGSPYAHVTAPLRRLADRYVTEVCLALFEGRPVPDWARAALPSLPKVMADTDRVASAAERGAVELAEAVVLADRVGELFQVTVIDVDEPRAPAPVPARGRRDAVPPRKPGGTVVLDDPAVRARCEGDLPLGERTEVRLVTADPARRQVLFALP
jgi:exoribonuclease R